MPRTSPPLLAALLLTGCAVDDRLALTVPVTARALENAPLSPAEGVTLTLTEAQLTLADLRLEAPAIVARRPSLLRAAHAHPGHDPAGGVAGELLGEWTLDLLGEDTALGDASCYEGPLATARLSLVPTPALTLVGVAEVDGAARPFTLTLSPEHEVTGLSIEAELDAASPPGGLSLSMDLNHGLSFIDWRTPDTDGDGALTEADGATLNTALFGLTSTLSWRLTLD
jgi:hypothetical protein